MHGFSSLFGAATSVSTPFGTASGSSSPLFGMASSTGSTTSSLFGMPFSTASGPSPFGAPASASSSGSLFGAAAALSTGSSGLFGATTAPSTTPAPAFGITSTTAATTTATSTSKAASQAPSALVVASSSGSVNASSVEIMFEKVGFESGERAAATVRSMLGRRATSSVSTPSAALKMPSEITGKTVEENGYMHERYPLFLFYPIDYLNFLYSTLGCEFSVLCKVNTASDLISCNKAISVVPYVAH
ncbi:hypothetical protein CDL15_Pgr008429 [Punica granatum]|uniref:Nuclear pore complex protein NUP62-like n=1 Tax=Punica granatum TaxID=22663 RepID=A0A218WNQ9_PUNGR|nr:hypothetical protein CDL15_Pgr008429 [Punica granatum]